jgi:predicted amidohydrolase
MGRQPVQKTPQLALDQVISLNETDTCRRHIVGIQPFMQVDDYLSKEAFESKMDGYLSRAQAEGYLNDRTVVLLPEYLGTWLLLAGEKNMLAHQRTMTSAMPWMIVSNPFQFIYAWWHVDKEKDRATAALFRMKAREMVHIYHQTFKHLSLRYKTTIVAGSILLPGPAVEGDSIVIDASAPLFNASFVFLPDGRVAATPVKKVFPTNEELPFVASARTNELPVFDLSIGRTAILVCADSWYPELYAEALKQGATSILVPSYCIGNGSMGKAWLGYSGRQAPGDVMKGDIGKITEGEAWSSYALEGRLHSSGAAVAANVFLRGNFWDQGSDGQSLFMRHGKKVEVQPAQRAGIWSLCW